MKLYPLNPTLPQGKGPAATAVRDMCFRMRRENPSLGLLAPAAVQSTSAGTAPPRIDRLILIDREVDVVTPLMSQVRGCDAAFAIACTAYRH